MNSKTNNDPIEAILVLQTSDEMVLQTLCPLFPNKDDISVAKRAVGGTEIKAWFTLGVGFLTSTLGFVSNNKMSLGQAKIIIGTKEIHLDGYSAKDAIKLMESEGMLKAIKTYSEK